MSTLAQLSAVPQGDHGALLVLIALLLLVGFIIGRRQLAALRVLPPSMSAESLIVLTLFIGCVSGAIGISKFMGWL